MAPAAAPRTYTQEEVEEKVRKAQESERKKQEAAQTGFEIIAPIANPKHEIWQLRNEKGDFSNPYKKEYLDKLYADFDCQVHPFVTPDGQEYRTPQLIKFVGGKGFTQDENVAKWVKSYYGYDIKKKIPDPLQAMVAAEQ